eukprot:3467063-Rhodomonas_salina.4
MDLMQMQMLEKLRLCAQCKVACDEGIGYMVRHVQIQPHDLFVERRKIRRQRPKAFCSDCGLSACRAIYEGATPNALAEGVALKKLNVPTIPEKSAALVEVLQQCVGGRLRRSNGVNCDVKLWNRNEALVQHAAHAHAKNNPVTGPEQLD